jgi:hypothetical protein
METQKSDAVLDSWLIILCFIHKQLFWAEIEAKRPNYGQIVLYLEHRLVRSDTVNLADRNLDRTVRVNYGRCRNYGSKSNITT